VRSVIEDCVNFKGCVHVIVDYIYFCFNMLSCLLNYFVIISSLDRVRNNHTGAKAGVTASTDLPGDKIEFRGSVLGGH
jgi:hypothetical protein